MNNINLLPHWFIAFYVFLIGLCVGSFLNVVVLRSLSGEKFIFERSKCPKCAHQLTWYMNVPLISYIFLKGKCAFCSEKISIQYPLVELICGLLFLFSYYKLGLNFNFLAAITFISFGIIISTSDFLQKVIVDTHAHLFALMGFLYSFYPNSQITWIQSILGIIFGFLILEIISKIFEKFLSQRPFGEGDSLILAAIGAYLGAKSLIIILPLAMLIQSIFTIPKMILIAFRENKKRLANAYLMIFLALLSMVILNSFNVFKNNLSYVGATLIIVISLLWSLKQIISELKEKSQKFNKLEINDDLYNEKNPYLLLPFGPALIVAGLICLFYMSEIKSFVYNYLF